MSVKAIFRRSLLSHALMMSATFTGRSAFGDERDSALQQRLVELERLQGGRLGVAILDTTRSKAFDHRGDERFAFCSTYKFLAAALVLARVDRKEERLDRRIAYAKSDLVPYSPVTGKHAGLDGLSLGEICEAAVTLSDNTAGNLLIDALGGPVGVTAGLRALGDSVTRLDRRETELNEALPDDPRDTTTPLAMLEVMRKTVLGDALQPASRAQLVAWLVACKTGDMRLRADVPKGWRIGDKTGTGANNATNDIAVFWPPDRAPILVVAFYIGAIAPESERNVVLAEIGRLAAAI